MVSYCKHAVAFLLCLKSLSAMQQRLVLAQNGCSSDSECSAHGKYSKCCPADGAFTYGCQRGVEYVGAPTKKCNPPGLDSTKEVQCTCSVPDKCINEGGVQVRDWPYKEAKPGMKQWLMVGDSISWGLFADAQNLAKEKGIELFHTPGNAKNVWWGERCMKMWLGSEPSRWDVVSFNFGLHDLSDSLERIEPTIYGETLASFVQTIHGNAPKAALLWASTTPASIGSERPCDVKAFQTAASTWGGCPPRKPEDVPVYNDAAMKALNSTALPIASVDLYSVVVEKCGEHFSKCDIQKPMEPHYEAPGNVVLAAAYVKAVAAAMP